MKTAKLLLSFFVLAASAASQTAAPMTIHVSSARLVATCIPNQLFGNYCGHITVLSEVINGKKVELENDQRTQYLMAPGDYQAHAVENSKNAPGELKQEYEFLFSDGTKRKYLLVGMEE